MLKNWKIIAPLAAVLSCPSLGHTQALPTATGNGALLVGGGWSYVRPDYGQKAIQGITAYGDFNFLPHVGAEAEYHYIGVITPTDLGENSFLVGPRYFIPHGRFNFYAKAVFGFAKFDIQEIQDNPGAGTGTYFAYAAGGGVDYRFKPKFAVRGDFEYQHWNYLTGLTPAVITVGFVYRLR
jgi:hypothetical protein